MTDLEEYLKNGLIRKEIADPEKTNRSVEIATHKLDIAKIDFDMKSYEDTMVNAYTSMFHSARALLFRDGYRERNHYALYIYIKEKYSKIIEAKYINELNTLRSLRHKIIYGDEEVNIREVHESETESAIKLAEGFLGVVRKLIK